MGSGDSVGTLYLSTPLKS